MDKKQKIVYSLMATLAAIVLVCGILLLVFMQSGSKNAVVLNSADVPAMITHEDEPTTYSKCEIENCNRDALNITSNRELAYILKFDTILRGGVI